MKKLLILLTVFFIPYTAFAVTPSVSSDWNSFTAEVDMTNITNWFNGALVNEYDSSHTCTGADIADAYVLTVAVYNSDRVNAPAGNTFPDMAAVNTIPLSIYEPITLAPGHEGYFCFLYYDGHWTTDNATPFHYIPGGGGGGSSSIADLIESASTTLYSNLGFGLGDIIDIMKSNMFLVIGSGAGLVQTLLPFIIVLVSIALIISVIYLAFKFFRQ